jgi:hypothetical protein
LRDKAAGRCIIEFDLSIHSLYELANDIKPDAAATTTRMTHEEFAQLIKIAGKALTVVRNLNCALIIACALNRYVDFTGVAMRHSILNQIS